MGRHIGFQSEHGRHGGGGSARRAGCRDGGTGSCMGISRRPGVGRMAAQADPAEGCGRIGFPAYVTRGVRPCGGVLAG